MLKQPELNNNRILLIGAPNTGKSTFFNRVTTGTALVGNYSGTTNQPNFGFLKNGFQEIIDLPGANSIIATTPSEKITNDYFLNSKYSHAIAFISALTMKKNLLALIDYLEAGKLTTLVITQIDEQKKYHIAKKQLKNLLFMNVVPIISTKIKMNSNLRELISNQSSGTNFKINYGEEIEKKITYVESLIKEPLNIKKRVIALQLFLGKIKRFKFLLQSITYNSLLNYWNSLSKEEKIKYQESIIIKRRNFVQKVITRSCLLKTSEVIAQVDKSFVDQILLNKFWGVIIFLIIMTGVYFLSFSQWTGSYLQAQISELLASDNGLMGVLKKALIYEDQQWFGMTLILDGIFAPIFLALSFFPYLFIFFFLVNIMKQTGYYARGVAVFDSILEKYGLSGHSMISIITGLGCNLPALISTRSIISKKERHITAFIIPLIPCSARLSVNTIIISLFFNNAYSWLIIVAITMASGMLWLLIGLVLSKTLFRKEYQWIVHPIPKWRKIDIISTGKASFTMIKSFIFRMTGYLVIAGIVIFLLSAFSIQGINIYSRNGYNNSFIFHISNAISYLFKPLGFGNVWQSSTALLSGIPAKEVVITALAATSGSVENIRTIFTPAMAISFIIFSSFYTPCTPATSILYKETKSTKWLTMIHLIFSFSFAWITAAIIYQLMSI